MLDVPCVGVFLWTSIFNNNVKKETSGAFLSFECFLGQGASDRPQAQADENEASW